MPQLRPSSLNSLGRDEGSHDASDLLHLVDGEMEAVILGTILNAGEPAHREAAFLTADDFAIEKHRLIWSAITRIGADVHPTIDAVAERLDEDGKLEAAGGLSGLVDVDQRGIPGLRLAGFARSLQTKAAERRAFKVISKLSNLAELGLRNIVDGYDNLCNSMEHGRAGISNARSSRREASNSPKDGPPSSQ
jgi:replicative DNA helicase